jgi:hypothetical protein|tara:strand:- start:366 stop:644 length:279 start_codon:yes stop_codon:yes gene_type:complete
VNNTELIYIMEAALNTEDGVPESVFEAFCTIRDTVLKRGSSEHDHVCTLLEECDAVDGHFFLPELSGVDLLFPNLDYHYNGMTIEPLKGKDQ